MGIGPYRVGDVPAANVLIDLDQGDSEDADLSIFEHVDAQLVDPAGLRTQLAATIDEAAGAVEIVWPEGGSSLFVLPGLYAIALTLSSPIGYSEQAAPVLFPVQEEDGWHTIESARAEWADAQAIGNVKLWRLLQIARMQVLDFAPALEALAPIPTHYVEAQLMQARNTWNAGRVSPSGEVGGDDFAITPHPLDWQIKQILRPRRGIPVVG